MIHPELARLITTQKENKEMTEMKKVVRVEHGLRCFNSQCPENGGENTGLCKKKDVTMNNYGRCTTWSKLKYQQNQKLEEQEQTENPVPATTQEVPKYTKKKKHQSNQQ